VLAPLRMAWLPSRAVVDSGPRLRDFLFGNPRRPGPWRGRRILRDNPEQVHCIVGEPGTLAELQKAFTHQQHTTAESEREKFAAFVARRAGIALDLAERRLQGGRYKVPRYVAESLLSSPAYLSGLEKLASDQGENLDTMLEACRGYIKEMVSIPSTFWIDVNDRFSRFVLGLGYEKEIVTDVASVENMRKMVRENPSMLLWTHKTYLDGMVVPRVMYDHDFPLPHMFGGANMSFAGLGFLLRRAGAIFIRRSFQDNLPYKLTLRHYIGYLMEKRFPMTWAFEGTRSRMGKLMPPRYGLLKYVLEACHTTAARNIHIIPISISYDLIRDVEEYATEQTGRGKGAESLRWFIGYIRSLAKPMGRIYMDVGDPVVLDRAPDPDDSLALSKIAFQVAVEANKVTPITFPSLVTMSLLGAAPRALTTRELVAETTALLEWAQARDVRVSSDFMLENQDHLRRLLDIMINENVLTRYDEGPESVYGISLEQHPVASYYRNTTIHFFVNKAIIELSLLKATEAEEGRATEVFWKETENLRDLFKFEFFYAPKEEFRDQIRTELERCSPDWDALLHRGSPGLAQLLDDLHPLVAHATLLTYVEAYRVVADLLAGLGADQGLEQKDCVSRALKYGRQAYLQRRITSEASIGKILFQNGFQQMQHLGLTEGGGEEVAAGRVAAAQQLRELARRVERIRARVMDRRGSF
jgi:glycerol-3-phosphate O-acyltransferase